MLPSDADEHTPFFLDAVAADPIYDAIRDAAGRVDHETEMPR